MNIASRTIANTRGLTAMIGLGLLLASAQLQAQSQDAPPAPYGPYSSSPSNDAGHNWVPRRPKNPYWQAPGQTSGQGNNNPQANRQTRSAPPQARNPYQQPAQQYSQQYAVKTQARYLVGRDADPSGLGIARPRGKTDLCAS